MTVNEVRKDPDALTMTIVSAFEASPERIWRLWSDPRQLERWWGPPGYPATFVDHDLSPGGATTYYMTGPEGEKHHGWWRVLEADPPRHLRFEDGFADRDGRPSEEMPAMTIAVSLTEADGRTTMEIETRFRSREEMDKMLEMGMDEGMSVALGQIDDILREQPD